MSKSRKYTVDGKKYVFSFNKDNELDGIQEQSGRAVFRSVDPNSNKFSEISSSSEALNALNVNKFKGTKESYQTAMDLAPNEELNKSYEERTKKVTNQGYIEEENGGSLATSNTGGQQYASPRKGSTEIFSYPLDLNTSQDHFKIRKFNYQRKDVNASKPGGTEIQTTTTGKMSKVKRTQTKVNVAGDSVVGSTPLGSVLLPMPKVTDVNGVEWGKSELTISGLAAVGLTDKLTGGGRLAGKSREEAENDKAIKKQIEEGRGINPDGSSVKQFGSALYAQTISKIAGFAFGTDLDVDTYLARSGGRVLNPNAEMLFQGPVIRDFAFSFIMIARSQKEGDEIRKIIRFLKLGMAPKFRSTTYLKNPDIFTLHYKSGTGENDELNTVNRFNPGGLALTTMAVDYAPNGYWSAYRDSQPVAVKMDLNFTELRPIYEQDQLNTPENSVGY